MCSGCSKELSHRDGSFVYPQHMFWLRNKKNNFQSRTHIWGLEYGPRSDCSQGSSLTLVHRSGKANSFESKNVIIFLAITLKVVWLLKRTVSLGQFFEFPQHVFWLRNKKI